MKARRVIIDNLLSLLGVQLVNYVLQLATLPFLVRKLSIAGFGQFAFVLAFAQYFLTLTDYGFNLTATRQISIARDDKKKISEIFYTVMLIKFVFFLLSVIIMVVLVLSFNKFRDDAAIYIVSLIAVFGNLIFPVWYYQGIEKTRFIALFNGIARIVTVICIFIFIRSPRDVLLAVFIQSISVVLAGFMSLGGIIKHWPVEFVVPKRESVVFMLKDGWNIFITLMSASIVTNINIFMLGFMTNNQIVGYYSVADKVVRVFHSLVSPLHTAIFPHVSLLFNRSKDDAISFLRKVILWGGMFFLGCCLLLILFSGLFVKVFTGSTSLHIQYLIFIMSIIPLSIFIDNIYGQQVLINIGCTKEFMVGILIPGIVSLAMSLLLVPTLKDYGAAITYLTSQLLILILMIHFVRKKDIYLIIPGLL